MLKKYGPAELSQRFMVMDTICDATQASPPPTLWPSSLRAHSWGRCFFSGTHTEGVHAGRQSPGGSWVAAKTATTIRSLHPTVFRAVPAGAPGRGVQPDGGSGHARGHRHDDRGGRLQLLQHQPPAGKGAFHVLLAGPVCRVLALQAGPTPGTGCVGPEAVLVPLACRPARLLTCELPPKGCHICCWQVHGIKQPVPAVAWNPGPLTKPLFAHAVCRRLVR